MIVGQSSAGEYGRLLDCYERGKLGGIRGTCAPLLIIDPGHRLRVKRRKFDQSCPFASPVSMPANFQKTVLALLVSGNNVPNQFVSGVCSYSCEGCYRPECDRWRSDLFGEEGILQTFPRHPNLSHAPGIGVRIRVSGSGGSSRWPGGALAPFWSANRCSLVHVYPPSLPSRVLHVLHPGGHMALNTLPQFAWTHLSPSHASTTFCYLLIPDRNNQRFLLFVSLFLPLPFPLCQAIAQCASSTFFHFVHFVILR